MALFVFWNCLASRGACSFHTSENDVVKRKCTKVAQKLQECLSVIPQWYV
jgi:hypothetical protein